MVLSSTVLSSSCVETPAGQLSLVVEGGGAVVAAGFCPVADLEARLCASSRPLADLGAVTRAVTGYLAGDLGAVDELQVSQRGTPRQQLVWATLRALPAGETVSYGGLAARLGLPPGASRAVGTACGANLVAPVVPCHRVVRGDGSLGGYYYGLPVKRWLLDHERATAGTLPGASGWAETPRIGLPPSAQGENGS